MLDKYILRKSRRARRLSLTVRNDCSITVTCPLRYSEAEALAFVQEHQEWIQKKISFYVKQGPLIRLSDGSDREFRRHRKAALAKIAPAIEHYSKLYGFSYKNIRIRKQRFRWASCSGDGNLNFNYQAYLLPDHLFEYLVVHELCHRAEMNHSERFWKLVEKVVPDYEERKDELRRYVL